MSVALQSRISLIIYFNKNLKNPFLIKMLFAEH